MCWKPKVEMISTPTRVEVSEDVRRRLKALDLKETSERPGIEVHPVQLVTERSTHEQDNHQD